ncbi:MAG TPA: hypothetical protein VGO18_01930 [Steroidobacteraceae bacterium]|nr:hypothetical protein [Steroidobacteraceae bacterium]
MSEADSCLRGQVALWEGAHGLVEVRLVSGGRWLLDDDRVTRLA